MAQLDELDENMTISCLFQLCKNQSVKTQHSDFLSLPVWTAVVSL